MITMASINTFKKFIRSFCFVLSFSLLTSCAVTDVNVYKNEKPEFDLEQYFTGKTEAWGIFQKRSGEVVKRFYVEIEGKRVGDELVLDERFSYSDGSKQTRIWRLKKNGDKQWSGRADDVKGTAEGEIAGNAFKWQYVLLLPVDGTTYEMHMDDWMYMVDQNTLVNRTKMSKFGIELGEVSIFFRRK
ncbi:DUF3833 domain-containing protein [Undibacterium cyanobacteriorum]|uniref:DUF3833 domain-containing protein n=1 Tax=Undibacterium cyanobacteriorum TaxID=3073561 RepID=A0ABY9RMR2_9BURK|nr:DUF3833 domain-containing protein [Undibacterium sp. 20NA77.5]WMW82472.1 DUF3833 domain-containing protein [Undibacterium sp. 20NA77.5]